MKSTVSVAKALAFAGATLSLVACGNYDVVKAPFANQAIIKKVETVLAAPVLQPRGDCRKSLGNPTLSTNGVDEANRQWEARNLVVVTLPWKAHAAWNPKLPMKGLQVHRLAAPSLQAALNLIWEQSGHSQAEIDRVGLSAIGGGFNWRPVRDGEGLSAHAYGCAVDFDPDRNAMGDDAPNFSRPENRYVVEDFQKSGWIWGGAWPRPDGMHFQAATIAKT